jgi:branched-subunit amino acid transport protein
MSDTWVLVGALAAGICAFRAVGPLLLGGRQLPSRARGAVELLAPTLFTALIVTQLFASSEELELDERAAGVVAAGVAVALRAPVWLVLLVAVLTTAALRAQV